MPYKDKNKERENVRLRVARYRARMKAEEPERFAEILRGQRKRNWIRHGKRYNENHKVWYQNNKEAEAQRMKRYREENRQQINEWKNNYNKQRRKNDDNFAIKSRLRCLIYNSVNLYGQGKKVEKSRKYGLNLNEISSHLIGFVYKVTPV
jgi:hypothetical protein